MQFSIIQKSKLEGALRLDAEYYQPEYLALVDNLKKLKAVSIKEIAVSSKRKFKPKKNELFQYVEISEIDLSTGEYNKREILGEDAPDRAQWLIEPNDIIISTVRPIRNAISLIRENTNNLVCSSGFAVLKTKNIEPEYLFVYLKSLPIVKLLDRQTTATMYPAITTEDILNTKIYLGDKDFRKEIKNKVIESQKGIEKSKCLYQQAEDLLLEELGLKDFELKDDLSYIVNLSDAKNANRIDAEFFQPKYKEIKSKIKNFEFKKLGDIVSIKKGVEPGSAIYQEGGIPFFRVSNVSKFGIKDNNQQYLSQEIYSKFRNNFKPETGEILLTKDATPGIAYYLDDKLEGIISGGILRLKPRIKIEPEYLTLGINSVIGQMQAEQDTGGSIIVHWRPEQIKNCLIPILPKPTQQKIADLVQQSHATRKKAKQLLEQAKQKVENLIRKG